MINDNVDKKKISLSKKIFIALTSVFIIMGFIIWAWGDYSFRHTPIKIMDSVATIFVGNWHTMAIRTDDSLWAWGNNNFGQLGDGTTTNRHVPVKIMDDVSAISTNGAHTMAIRNDGSLWAWGGNWYGQLGDGKFIRLLPPRIQWPWVSRPW